MVFFLFVDISTTPIFGLFSMSLTVPGSVRYRRRFHRKRHLYVNKTVHSTTYRMKNEINFPGVIVASTTGLHSFLDATTSADGYSFRSLRILFNSRRERSQHFHEKKSGFETHMM